MLVFYVLAIVFDKILFAQVSQNNVCTLCIIVNQFINFDLPLRLIQEKKYTFKEFASKIYKNMSN